MKINNKEPSGPEMIYKIEIELGREITKDGAEKKWNKLSDKEKERVPRMYNLYVVDGF